MLMRFYSYELDVARRELRREGVPVPLQPRAFDLLAYLAKERHRLVPKAELMDRFWPANASEAALQKAVSLARKAVSDDTRDARVIRTHHGLGFRFVAPLIDAPAELSEQREVSARHAPALDFQERRFATVLAVRYRKAGTRAPAAEAALEAFLREGKSVIEARDGALLRMMPDGFTAVFGLTVPCEDGPRRAAQSALALVRFIAESGDGDHALAPSFGIETGVLEVAIDPSVNGQEDDTWAPPGGLEFRALDLAGSGRRIVLGHEARMQLRDEIEVVPGAEPGTWALQDVITFGSSLPARPQKIEGGFLGRETELAYLDAALSGVTTGAGCAILITGQAGIGKSRLVAEACDRVDQDLIRQVRVQCLPRLRRSPAAPIQAMCVALFGSTWPVDHDDPVDRALAQQFLKVPENGNCSFLNQLSPRELQARSHRVLIEALEVTAARRPLLLVFEDVHWIDTSSYEVLAGMIRGLDGSPVVILMTSRPSDQTAALSAATLSLSRLNYEDSLRLFEQTAPFADIPETHAARLTDRAEGNPFFIEELAMAAASDADALDAMPPTLQAVIAGRIGSLAPDLRRLVYLLAVIGPPADPKLAAQLLDQPVSRVDGAIAELTRYGLVRREIDGVVFRHMLLHDAVYAMMPEEDRARLHREIAEILQALSEQEAVMPERLAWHWQEAGEQKLSIHYWSLASRAALHRSARSEAIAFADAGLALITGDSDEAAKAELGLLMTKAPAL